MAEVKFYRCDQDTFDARAAASGGIHDGEVYFITDKGYIEQIDTISNAAASRKYGLHVEVVSADYATGHTGRPGVLYICGTVGKKYDSTNGWTTLFQVTPDNTSSAIVSNNANAVSGNAVRSYLDTNYPLGSTSGCVAKLSTGGVLSSDVLPSNLVYLTDGKINADYLPAIALSEYVGDATMVGSASDSPQTGLYALTAQPGDWARVTSPATGHESEEGTYIYAKTSSNPDTYAWILMSEHVDTITVDSSLSSTSENPVQNKVIYSALSGKIDKPTTSTAGTGKFLKATNNNGTLVISWEEPLAWTDLASNS